MLRSSNHYIHICFITVRYNKLTLISHIYTRARAKELTYLKMIYLKSLIPFQSDNSYKIEIEKWNVDLNFNE